jgi:hypothetical protein
VTGASEWEREEGNNDSPLSCNNMRQNHLLPSQGVQGWQGRGQVETNPSSKMLAVCLTVSIICNVRPAFEGNLVRVPSGNSLWQSSPLSSIVSPSV